MDGTVLPEGEGHTITFTWLGVEYEIDLSDMHAEQLAAMMGPVIAASRRVGGRPSRTRSAVAVAAATQAARTITAKENGNGNSSSSGRSMSEREKREKLAEIRKWAQENGFPEQGDRGRLTLAVRDAWNEAHPDEPAPDETNPRRELANA
jgi:hypothetical protein